MLGCKIVAPLWRPLMGSKNQGLRQHSSVSKANHAANSYKFALQICSGSSLDVRTKRKRIRKCVSAFFWRPLMGYRNQGLRQHSSVSKANHAANSSNFGFAEFGVLHRNKERWQNKRPPNRVVFVLAPLDGLEPTTP